MTPFKNPYRDADGNPKWKQKIAVAVVETGENAGREARSIDATSLMAKSSTSRQPASRFVKVGGQYRPRRDLFDYLTVTDSADKEVPAQSARKSRARKPAKPRG